MNLIRPYGETAQNLSVAGSDGERRDVARRLISQSADMCLMCACALDSAVIEGGGVASRHGGGERVAGRRDHSRAGRPRPLRRSGSARYLGGAA